MNATVYEALRKTLAESYVLLIKTHNYHWNVKGPQFVALHNLFELQYNELFLAVDELAERLRALGQHAPGTMAEFAALSQVKDGQATKASDMVADLRASHTLVAQTARKGVKASEGVDDVGTADLLTARSQIHEKAAWMLASILEEEAAPAAKTPSASPAAPAKKAAKPAPKAETVKATAPKVATPKPAAAKRRRATG
ncbi:MAG TPA: Dps family protein [Fimbriimonadaceae bacterium]|nr:DNA starvation/stationary phase protection protein [Armatimonadota bacterium]HRD31094.1 Dps family protein [Fimbriimonadaceae bacterium]HRE93484.1 Dps family protein [Fimbriimonadaceae bacterium]HRI73907.1 Dps family protein [Fimbriimonadaceae bacterium]